MRKQEKLSRIKENFPGGKWRLISGKKEREMERRFFSFVENEIEEIDDKKLMLQLEERENALRS